MYAMIKMAMVSEAKSLDPKILPFQQARVQKYEKLNWIALQWYSIRME